MSRVEYPPLAEMAQELIKRHPEAFRCVPLVTDILFVMDTEAEPKSKGAPVLARVSKIDGKFVDFVCDGNKLWILEWFNLSTGEMTLNQKRLLMAHELLHFEYNEETGEHRLRGHDVEEFHLIADRFGTRWTSTTRGDVADIMAPGFVWGAQGQKRLSLETEPDGTPTLVFDGSPKDLSAIMQEAAAQINSGALDSEGTKVTAILSNVTPIRRTAAAE